MKYSYLFHIGFLGLLVLSVARAEPAEVKPVPANGKPAPANVQVAPADHALRPGDQVRVEVADEPDLSGNFSINKNGEVSLPLLGRVNIAGLRAAAAAAKIQGLYAKDILTDPKVKVSVRAMAPQPSTSPNPPSRP